MSDSAGTDGDPVVAFPGTEYRHRQEPIKRPDPEVIAALERVLADTRRGEVIGVMILTNHSDECTLTQYYGVWPRTRLVGELEYAKSVIIDVLKKSP